MFFSVNTLVQIVQLQIVYKIHTVVLINFKSNKYAMTRI